MCFVRSDDDDSVKNDDNDYDGADYYIMGGDYFTMGYDKKMIMMTIITSWVVHFSSIVLLHGHSDGPAEPEHHVNFKPDNHDHPNLTKVGKILVVFVIHCNFK